MPTGKLGDHHGQRGDFGTTKDHGVGKVVPSKVKGEKSRHDETRSSQWNDYHTKNLERAGTVHLGGFLDLSRKIFDKTLQYPDGKRQIKHGVRENETGIRIHQSDKPENDKQR